MSLSYLSAWAPQAPKRNSNVQVKRNRLLRISTMLEKQSTASLRMSALLFSFNKKEEKTAEWNWCICPIENSLVGRKQSKEDQEVHSLNSISGFLISHSERPTGPQRGLRSNLDMKRTKLISCRAQLRFTPHVLGDIKGRGIAKLCEI